MLPLLARLLDLVCSSLTRAREVCPVKMQEAEAEQPRSPVEGPLSQSCPCPCSYCDMCERPEAEATQRGDGTGREE